MSDLSKELLLAADSLVGAKFNQHYISSDPCRFGVGADYTDPICLKRGLGQNGAYDCMGLVIGAMSDVLGLDPEQDWPVDFRHLEQLAKLAEERKGRPGDIVMIYRNARPNHMGILYNSEEYEFIHATTLRDLNKVIISVISPYNMVRHIAAEALAGVVGAPIGATA
jgi:hypothetical protein